MLKNLISDVAGSAATLSFGCGARHADLSSEDNHRAELSN
jgi:hypothetical protein